jgi:ubiquinone biosynthesis protein COQ4
MPRSLLDRLRIARSAMQQLTEDPDRTEMVFEITEALAGRQPERLLRRVQRDPAGIRLLSERPAFDPEHCDLDALMQLPAGSFGHTFAEWMKENDFAPGLMQRDFDGGDPDLAYLWRAYRAGRRARFLAPLVLEDLFPLPLPTVREMLRIEPLTEPFVPEGLPPIAAPLAA